MSFDKAIRGYSHVFKKDPTAQANVMVLDAATPGDYPFAITMSFPVLILLIVLKNGIHTVAGLSINMMKLIMRHFAIMVCRRLSFLSRLAMGKELIKIK